MKKMLSILLLGIAIIGCYKVLEINEQKEKNKAIEKCGSQDNLIINYTHEGDRYYSCKVEK